MDLYCLSKLRNWKSLKLHQKSFVLCYSENDSHELTQQAQFFKVDGDNGARLSCEG